MTLYINILEESLFDLKNKKSVVVFLHNGKKYTVDGSSITVRNQQLIKKLPLLNPLQLLFHLITEQRFKDKSFSSIVLSPTSSGKTGTILLYIQHFISLFTNSKKPSIVYVSPLKALAREKFEEFREVFGDVVELRTGDNIDRTPEGKTILACTPDYLSLAIRNNLRFLKNIQTIIIDEVHTIFSSSDKPVLDEVLWYVKETKKPFLVLSATIPLIEEMIDFLQPDLFINCKWKPVETVSIVKAVDTGDKNFECPFEKEMCEKKCPFTYASLLTPSEKITYSIIKEIFNIIKHHNIEKTILFVGTKKEGWKILEALNHNCCFEILNLEDDLPFEKNSECSPYHKAAFYCADIEPKSRVHIENAFKKDPRFKVLISTHGLAYGVNFPADLSAIIIKNSMMYGGLSLWPTVIDCIQMAGRAGRFGYSDKGYVLYLLKHKKTFYEAKTYLEKPETYPVKTIIGKRDTDNLCANVLLYAAKRNLPVSSCKQNSFLLYLSNKDLSEVKEIMSFLATFGLVEKTPSGYALTKRGEFCFVSGVSPYTYLRVETFYHIINESVKDNTMRTFYKFLISSPLSSSFEATYDLFINVLYNKPLVPQLAMTEATKSLPQWHMLRHIERFQLIYQMTDPYLLSYGISQQEKDSITIISLIFHLTGVYFLSGMPKVLPDLSFISPSTFMFYARNLNRLANSYNMFSPLDTLLFTHMLDTGMLPTTLCLCLPLKTKKKIKGLGQLRTAILNLVMQSLDLTHFKMHDFIYIHKTFENLKTKILEEKQKFMDTVSEVLDLHLTARAKFKKTMDKNKILSENRKFFKEFLKTLEETKLDEDIYYKPFLLEVSFPKLKQNIHLGKKEEILNYLKVISITFSH